MTVEIIALVEKNYGQKVLEEMKSSPGVLQILNAAGRSSDCLLYTSPSPRDRQKSRMPSSA